MPDRFTLLVEARRPISCARLPAGRVLGCAGCPEILRDAFWARPDDMVDPYNAPVWCTACALRTGRLVVVRVEPATEEDRAWEPEPPPEPDLVTVDLPGGFTFRLEQRG